MFLNVPIQTNTEVCILSHGNWAQTERAIASVLDFGLSVHVGVTVDATPLFRHENVRFYNVPWDNHFANARNNLLSQIKSDCTHFLWLDSDEILFSFSPAEVERQTYDVFGVLLLARKGLTSCTRICCHRNIPEIMWSGGIHEKLVDVSADNGRQLDVSGIVIRHFGYDDQDTAEAKLKRNMLIARSEIDGGADSFGCRISIGRYHTMLGKGSALDWAKVYLIAETEMRERFHITDERWEPAAMMAQCGLLKPAENISEENPLNIPLQISILVGSFALNGQCSPKRLSFIADCLTNFLWDDRYGFETELIGMNTEELLTYVKQMAIDLPASSQPTELKKDRVAMNPDTVLIRAGDVLSELFQDERILLSRKTNLVVSLNQTAQVIWDALALGISQSEAVQMMREASASSPEIEKEIEELFKSLMENGFVLEA